MQPEELLKQDEQTPILLLAASEDAETVTELRQLLAEMDGHLNADLMAGLRIQVERVIAWEDLHAD